MKKLFRTRIPAIIPARYKRAWRTPISGRGDAAATTTGFNKLIRCKRLVKTTSPDGCPFLVPISPNYTGNLTLCPNFHCRIRKNQLGWHARTLCEGRGMPSIMNSHALSGAPFSEMTLLGYL